ncbi:MAG: nitroreductase family protein, partial [bacterium]
DFLKNTAVLGTGLTFGFSSKARSLSDTGSEELSVLECIHRRRSVRAFKSDPVPEEYILKILDAARMAPTSGNQQPWKFLVIRDRKKLNTLKEASLQRILTYYENKGMTSEKIDEQKKRLESHYHNIFQAPVFIVILTDTQSKYPSYNHHDGPLAVANLMLAARALGYGTCYFTDSISEEVTMKVLEIPDRYQRVCVTPIGVPVEWPQTPPKRKLDEFIVYDELKI